MGTTTPISLFNTPRSPPHTHNPAQPPEHPSIHHAPSCWLTTAAPHDVLSSSTVPHGCLQQRHSTACTSAQVDDFLQRLLWGLTHTC